MGLKTGGKKNGGQGDLSGSVDIPPPARTGLLVNHNATSVASSTVLPPPARVSQRGWLPGG